MATAHSRPRFRSDLVATPLEMGGNRFIDVTDPDSEETFRFYEVEYSIACAMDGQRDVPALIDWARQELGLEPEIGELETVINTLADLGYLDADAASGRGPAAQLHSRADAGAEVELGAPGASSLRPSRPEPPSGGDIELGAPGRLGGPSKPGAVPGKVTMGWDTPPVSAEEFDALVGKDSLGKAGAAPPPPPAKAAEPKATLKPRGAADVDEEGPTQIPEAVPPDDDDDVSVDLSDHLSIDTNDVKEAVRQSKVMNAVEVPDDLAAALDEEAAEEPPAVAKKPLAAAALGGKPERKLELPDKPASPASAVAAKEAPAEPKSSATGLLLIVLVIVALAAGGAYWYLNIYQKDEGGASGKPAAGANDGQSGAKLPTPGPAAAKLVATEPDAAEVEAVADGIIAMIAVEGDEVEEGALVASLKGVAAVERSLARPRRKLAEYSAKLEEAKQEGHESAIERYQNKVDEKRALVEAGEAKLAKLNMHAPAAGTVVPVVAAGAKVAQGDPVVRILGAPGLAATFPTRGKSFEVDAECTIAAKPDPHTPIACVVDSVEGDRVTVRVSPDTGLAAGDEVILR